MNILDVEDMIKGLPDQRLQQEAEAPTGQVPQFLVISEIQRRTDMRKRFADQQQQAPQGTVKDQVVQQGIAAIAPPDPQMQAAMGAPVQMAAGRGVPFSEDDPNMQYLQRLKDQGFSREDIQRMISGMFYNTADEATVQSVTDQPTSTVMPPNRQGVGSVMDNIPMTDIVRPGNAAYAALDQIFGRQAPVVDAMGDFEPTPRDPEEYSTDYRFYPNTSPAMRQRMVDRALANANKPSQAFLDELSAGSRERRNRQPSEAVGTFSAPQTAYTQEMYDENVGGFRNIVDQDPSRYPDIKTFPVTDVDRMYASELSKMTGETVAPQGTDPKLAARTNQLIQNEYEDLLRDREQQTELLKQIDAVGSSGTVRTIDNARSQSPKPVATGAQQADASRAKATDFTGDLLDAIVAPDAAGNAPQNFNQQFGINPTDYTERKEKKQAGYDTTDTEQMIKDSMTRFYGSELGRGATGYSAALGLADLIEGQERPTLSYKELVDEYEAETQKQLADIKSERGSQALIALGAGIARGKLGDGLSEAGKVVAASNAQKRAVEAKDRAAKLGLKKSEMDAAFASEIDRQRREVEAQKVRIAGLKDFNISQQKAESVVLNMEKDLRTFLFDAYKQRKEEDDRESLNRRALANYVTAALDDLLSPGDSPQRKAKLTDLLIKQGSSFLLDSDVEDGIPMLSEMDRPDAGTDTDTKRILFDDQGNPLQ